jgi:thymidylate synthase
MQQYLAVMRDIRENGEWKENRTGIRTLMIDGAMARYDLRKGFPAVTTKKLAWNAVKGELCGFLRGFTSAADFRDFGCRVWDQNANENKQWLDNPFRKGTDHLGPVYGAQWRNWKAYKKINDYSQNATNIAHKLIKEDGWESIVDDAENIDFAIYYKEIDQIRECITKIFKDPDNRRNIFHAWNFAELDEMALVPCHLLYQFLPNKDTKEMSLVMYQRSCDYFLGVPFNVASASLLLEIVCHLTGYKPKNFVHFMADVHLYENHLDQVDEQLSREPLPLPTLKITGLKSYDEIYKQAFIERPPRDGVYPAGYDPQADTMIDLVMKEIDNLHPDMFELENYQHHAAIKAPMAV